MTCNTTWPTFNPIDPVITSPAFQMTGAAIPSSKADPASAVMSYTRMEIMFQALEGFQSMTALASSVLGFDVVQTADALDFVITDPDEVELDESEQLQNGPHTHTLFLHHQVSIAVVKELNPFLQGDQPVPVLVKMIYEDAYQNELHSLYMGNIVQYAGQRFYPGLAAVKTTAIQCFAVAEFQNDTKLKNSDLFSQFMTQAMINALQYVDEDEEDEEGDLDFDEEEDENDD